MRVAVREPPALGDVAGQLVLADLLNDAATLARLMVAEAGRGSWLDAYLLAAGLNQVAEDWMHRDWLSMRNAARVLSAAGTIGRIASGLVLLLRTAGLLARQLDPGHRRTQRWQAKLSELVDGLAGVVTGEPKRAAVIVEQAQGVAAGLEQLPAGLASSILRLPSCFRSLDQRPEDLAELAGLFAQRWPDRTRPLLLIGLRTSGSYLAPLEAAYLRGLGYTVDQVTLRPGQDLLRTERALFRRAGHDRRTVLICDDPPRSGNALAEAARQVEAAGVEHQHLVLLVAMMAGMPERLRGFQVAALPPDRWRIRKDLQPAAVRAVLGARSVEVLELPRGSDLKTEMSPRVHARALYRVTWDDGAPRLVYAKGLGLGYFGRYTLAVGRRLGEYLPEAFAVRNGVLFREWLPEECRLSASMAGPGVAHRIASYVADRATRLPAAADHSLMLAGRHPLWQRVADRLGRGFRGVRPFVRPAVHRLTRRLLAAPRPSVVDGSLALAEWFAHPDSGAWLKVDYDERAFSNEDLHVYDAAWDLAVAAADAEMEAAERLAGELREEYERQSARQIEDVRWLLYRIHHLAGFAEAMSELFARGHPEPGPVMAARDRAAEAAERLLIRGMADRLLGDLTVPPHGPLVGIDVDGVLETAWLGFSSITPAGCLAMRALLTHGFRPVLVSGRSLAEVVMRCRELRLIGAVAEYGAVAYRAEDGACRQLLNAAEQQALRHARRELVQRRGVHLDPRSRCTLRAYRLDGTGNRRGLGNEAVEAALSATSGGLRAVHGWAQTDFVPTTVDKGAGVRALLEMVAPDVAAHERPLALAVGDTEADLPMLDLAERRWGPANAEPQVRSAGVRIARRRFQAGLAEAVADLIRHRPGGCPRCRPPEVHGDERLLLLALAAQDAGPWTRLATGWRLYREAGR